MPRSKGRNPLNKTCIFFYWRLWIMKTLYFKNKNYTFLIKNKYILFYQGRRVAIHCINVFFLLQTALNYETIIFLIKLVWYKIKSCFIFFYFLRESFSGKSATILAKTPCWVVYQTAVRRRESNWNCRRWQIFIYLQIFIGQIFM